MGKAATVETVGEMLRQARRMARLSMEAVGERVGMSRWTVYRIECGKKNLSLRDVARLARACGMVVEIQITEGGGK